MEYLVSLYSSRWQISKFLPRCLEVRDEVKKSSQRVLIHLTFSFFSLLLYHAVFCFSTHAGIFKDEEDIISSQQKAEILKGEIFPGRMIVNDTETFRCYASATAIGRPGEKETKTALSSAYPYSEWSNPKYTIYFVDNQNTWRKVDKALTLTNDKGELDCRNDIVMYYLEDSIPCNPNIEIVKYMEEQVTLSSLSYGLALPLDKEDSCRNLYGGLPYCMQNTCKLYKDIYIHEYIADRFIYLQDDDNPYSPSCNYLTACNPHSTIFEHQAYVCDVGSSWFFQNNTGYSLAAVTSLLSHYPVEFTENQSFLSEMLVNKTCFVKSFPLKESFTTWDNYCPLFPHREWIYQHILS